MSELENWPVLIGLFPAGWRELGRASGAVRRLRGFASLDALLHTLLLHVGCGWSLRETAVQAKLAGIADVSDVTLLNRLRDAEPWLQQMCRQLWTENQVALAEPVARRAVRLLDATVVREPGKTGSRWRIHYSLCLPSLACDHFELTSARGAGSGERFGRFHFQPGELVLADAGYCHAAGIAEVDKAGAALCVRLNPFGLFLLEAEGNRFALLEHLDRLAKTGDLAAWPVWVQAGDRRVAGRVCAIRKSQQAIARAERRLTRKQQRGFHVGPDTRRHAEYVLVFTTLPEDEASAEQVLETYRLRWQIELTFKRLKSIAQIGHIPKHDAKSSRAWLYAKLLVALLSQKLTRIGKSISPWGYLLSQAFHPKPVA